MNGVTNKHESKSQTKFRRVGERGAGGFLDLSILRHRHHQQQHKLKNSTPLSPISKRRFCCGLFFSFFLCSLLTGGADGKEATLEECLKLARELKDFSRLPITCRKYIDKKAVLHQACEGMTGDQVSQQCVSLCRPLSASTLVL